MHTVSCSSAGDIVFGRSPRWGNLGFTTSTKASVFIQKKLTLYRQKGACLMSLCCLTGQNRAQRVPVHSFRDNTWHFEAMGQCLTYEFRKGFMSSRIIVGMNCGKKEVSTNCRSSLLEQLFVWMKMRSAAGGKLGGAKQPSMNTLRNFVLFFGADKYTVQT